MRKSFFISFYSLARLSREVRDKFLRLKLIKKTNSFFNNFLEAERPTQNVAHYNQLTKNLLVSVNEILEFLEMLTYLKKLDLSPALLVQKNLLNFKSKVLDSVRNRTVLVKESVFREEGPGVSVSGPGKDQKEKRSTNIKNRDLNEKIVVILKSSGGIQTKELVTALKGQFSRRTVQRYLNSLLASGEVSRKKEAGYSKYFITE